MKWLALDIGGASLKAADGEGFTVTQHFPLWQNPRNLTDALRGLLALVPRVDHVAATMTSELADCFVTRREGVEFILNALSAAVDSRHTRVYLTNGTLVTLQVALRRPLLAAASNWHALASFAGRYVERGVGLLVDVGGTTCDVIPLVNGAPVTVGRTDTKRLINGELIYTGVERSPVCAIINTAPYRGRKCTVAQEVFSTTWDVYMMLGELPEEPQNTNTADRRPATKEAALDRLARTICADRETFTESDARAMAETVAKTQLARMAVAAGQLLSRLPEAPRAAVISGRGEFLARRLVDVLKIEGPVISLGRELGPELSRCAAAHALAVLAREGPR